MFFLGAKIKPQNVCIKSDNEETVLLQSYIGS